MVKIIKSYITNTQRRFFSRILIGTPPWLAAKLQDLRKVGIVKHTLPEGHFTMGNVGNSK